MTKFLLLYVTCESKIQAEDIGRQLLNKKLAACINVIDKVESEYLWPPKSHRIEEAQEAVLLAKTTDDHWTAAAGLIEKLHTYETPDIMAIPIAHVSEKYSDWLVSELS